jgi:hypothetical protein
LPPVGFLAPVVPAQYPAGAAGQIRHIGTPLVQDQVEAGAQPIPPLLEGCDVGHAAGDFASDGGGGKRGLEFADADCGFGEMVGR